MWIKAKERLPKPGDLVVLRNPSTTYDECGNPINAWEYDAGIVEASASGKYLNVSIAHGEYAASFDDETEWQKLKE